MRDEASDDPFNLERPADDAGVTVRGAQGKPGTWRGPSDTPLIASRSLGRLIGLESLLFKVECWQPTGSWLDRSASAVVDAAIAEGWTGLCTVGVEVWTVPLALRCAQTGLRSILLAPTATDRAEVPERPWLSSLGVQTVFVDAEPPALREIAARTANEVGLRLVPPDDPLLNVGLSEVVQEVDRAGHVDAVLALPSLAGSEHGWLAATALMRQRLAVVGRLVSDVGAGEDVDESLVLAPAVTPRAADAARRLLAREEGLLVSRRGAAALAGMVRALREDRAKRPRERRIRGVTSAVVVLTGDPIRSGDGPPAEPDAVPARRVSLESLAADLGRVLVEPPGR